MRRFLATFFVFFACIGVWIGSAWGREVSIDFYEFPKDAADLFRAKFPDLKREFSKFPGDPVQLFIYYDPTGDEYKMSLIMGHDASLFGVDERRVMRDKLDLRPFVPYFLLLDAYRTSVKKSTSDQGQRSVITRLLMSVMLINTRGDRFEFYGDTDFFMGVREAIISPNFTIERKGKKSVTIYMEPTAVVSQVFILPPARDENKRLKEASLIYDFFSFDY